MVDAIVAPLDQALRADHLARDRIADFHDQGFGAFLDVAARQKIRTAAGAAEHVTLHQAVGLRGIAGHAGTGFAIGQHVTALPLPHHAVKCAVRPHHMVKVFDRLEIAPHQKAAVALDLGVEFARGRGQLFHQGIVTRRHPDFIGFDVAQHLVGEFAAKVAEQILQIILARVDRGGKPRAVVQHPVDKPRNAAARRFRRPPGHGPASGR